jgi:hypothetical protein
VSPPTDAPLLLPLILLSALHHRSAPVFDNVVVFFFPVLSLCVVTRVSFYLGDVPYRTVEHLQGDRGSPAASSTTGQQ